jgi:hypothetical protein
VVHIPIPDSEVARTAGETLRTACDGFLVAHCERAYRFAALLAARDGCDLDDEALYVGVLLHDLGLSARYEGPERFEVRGANVARRLLVDAGWSRDRVETVWDVIALHTSREIARHKSPEANYANQGISLDIRARPPTDVDDAAIRAVLDEWPRATFPEAMAAALVREVRARPGATRSTWMEHIALAEVAGFGPSDFIGDLRATADFA